MNRDELVSQLEEMVSRVLAGSPEVRGLLSEARQQGLNGAKLVVDIKPKRFEVLAQMTAETRERVWLEQLFKLEDQR